VAQPFPFMQSYYDNEYDPLAEPVFTKPDKPEESPIMAARLIKANTEEQSTTPVKVRVIDRWRVVYNDKPYLKGEVVTVPEHVAAEWEQSRWVERVTTKEKS
jgi:hypothetical protein